MNSLFTLTTTAAVTASAASLGAIGALLLIVLLAKRVLFEGLEDARAVRLAQALTVAITPLLIAFAMIAYFKVSDMLH